MENLTEKKYKKRVDAIISFAKRGGWPVTDELTVAEEELYRDMQNLYARFRQGIITVEEGQESKRQILNRFWSRRNDSEFRISMAKHYADMMMRIESAANAYAKNRTLDNADRLYKALYGMAPGKEDA